VVSVVFCFTYYFITYHLLLLKVCYFVLQGLIESGGEGGVTALVAGSLACVAGVEMILTGAALQNFLVLRDRQALRECLVGFEFHKFAWTFDAGISPRTENYAR